MVPLIPLNPQVIKTGLKAGGKVLVKAAPTIGVIVGTALMAGATVKTGIEAPKLRDSLAELDAKEDISHKEYLITKTKVLVYHLGWPAVMMLLGMGMIFGGYKIKYTQAAIATAALASKTEEVEKIEQKVLEKYGPKEYEKMKDDIAKDDAKSHPVNYSTVINTGHGTTLCYDPIFHDYYWSDLDYIRKMVDQANMEMTRTRWGMMKSAMNYNTFRDYLDLPASNENTNAFGKISPIDIGKDIGWYNAPIELKITVLLLQDDTPCHIIGFTKNGSPKWRLNLEDSNGEDADRLDYDGDDDETDMHWRGR